jgi:hypothetical protein
VSYNASAVKFYNSTGSLARFENKNISFYFEKRSSLWRRWRCSCKLRSCRIGSRNPFLNVFPSLSSASFEQYYHQGSMLWSQFLPICGEKIGVFLINQCYDFNYE